MQRKVQPSTQYLLPFAAGRSDPGSFDSLATVSSMLHGEYGIEDVCLSTLTLVGPNGTQGKVQMRMNKEEVALLKKSADALKEVIAQIEL